MRITKYYCDVCGEEIKSIYYNVGQSALNGLLLNPENILCCSLKCISEWITKHEIVR